MTKRPYKKTSQYWNLPRSPLKAAATVSLGVPSGPIREPGSAIPKDFHPALVGDEQIMTRASQQFSRTTDGYRDQWSGINFQINSFKNLQSGIIPFDNLDGNQGVMSIVSLANFAYFNVAIVRNTIDVLQEFSARPLHLKCKNKTVRDFFKAWTQAIGLTDLTNRWFREWFRSGNVFVYTFRGNIGKENFKKMQEAFSARSSQIPIRYTILNPMQVYLQGGVGYNNQFIKILSTYEIVRLKEPKTEEDKQVFNDLPEFIKNQVKAGAGYRYLFIPLDQSRLYFAFYKKQDYEPLAVPMVFPVLADIEFKLEMKRMDMALMKSLEQVVLLVTAGEKADDKGNGINPAVLNDLRSIFENQTIGRVLVADYTTKLQFIIPDIKDLIGPAKYERVDRDIREGLQYVMFGEEKFANASVKMKVLVERLREGREAFLNNFLMPQVRSICNAMNFQIIPRFEFEDIDLEDQAVMDRIVARFVEIGVLTPEEAFEALKTGSMPTKDESVKHQTEYRDWRKDNLYQPLIQAGKQQPTGRPEGTTSPQTTKNIKPIGTKSHYFGALKIGENTVKMNQLKEKVVAAWTKKAKITELDEAQEDVVKAFARAIFVNENESSWDQAIKDYLKNPKDINAEVAAEIDEIALQHDVDFYRASILYKSQVEPPKDENKQPN